MPRAQEPTRIRASADHGARPRGAEAAVKSGRLHRSGTVAGLAGLAVFLGALAGAHLALSNVPEPASSGARLTLEASQAASVGVPMVTAAAPRRVLAEVAPKADEAALARLYEEPLVYEEPLEPAPAPHGLAGALAGAPADTGAVRLAALPAPADIPMLVPARRPPQWLRNAVPVAVEAGQPMIAIVLDDLGLNRPAARRAIALPAPLTLSFMTYAKGLRRFAADARAAGHELLLHVPMEPRDPSYDPGPKVLRTGLSRAEIARRLQWGLQRFDGFVGINNHMGSKFTATPEGIVQVMRELRARDLLFLDSVTSAASVAWRAAARSGVPFARRDVFLDHDRREPEAVRRQLDRLERIARQRGYAVGIGHPHAATLEVLAAWLPEARRRGVALVPISAIVGHQIEIARRGGRHAG